MRRLCVSAAKNSTKLQSLFLCLQVNNTIKVQIARITEESPKFQILRCQSARLATQYLKLRKNLINWYWGCGVFPGELLLLMVLPEALPAMQWLDTKCHTTAFCSPRTTLGGELKQQKVGMADKREQKAFIYDSAGDLRFAF